MKNFFSIIFLVIVITPVFSQPHFNLRSGDAPGLSNLSFDQLLGHNKSYDIDGPNVHEKINLVTSSLSLYYSEINEPVDGGLSMVVGRMTYGSTYDPVADSEWVMTGGVIVDFHNVPGYTTTDSHYNAVYIAADGSRQALVPNGAGFVTINHWTGTYGANGYVLVSPKGVTYTFSQEVTDDVQYYYLTKVADQSGNSISYQYSGMNLVSITSNDGRSIGIEYIQLDLTPNYSIEVPSVIMFNGVAVRQYRYSLIKQSDGFHIPFLSQVILPDGRSWQYGYSKIDYAPISSECGDTYTDSNYFITTVINPNGEKTTYSYSPTTSPQFYDRCFLIPGITGKTNTDPDGKSWTWSFNTLSVNRNDKTVRITNPEYAVDYTVGVPDDDWNWENGSLINKIIYATPAAKIPLKTIHNTWIYTDSYASQSQTVTLLDFDWRNMHYHIAYSDRVAFRPLLYAQKITLGSNTYENQYSNWDMYGIPQEIVQTGDNDKTRDIKLSYFSNPTKNIIDKPASMTVDNVNVANRKYDDSGHLLQFSHYGQTTTYTYDAQGNIATITDPLNHVTTYGDYVAGQPTKITNPDGSVVNQTINPTGTIASKTDANGNTTTYTYDGLNRPTKITEPNDKVSTITYNGAAGLGGSTKTAGPLTTITTVNGFGSPINILKEDTTSETKHYSVFTYDGLNRKTYQSYTLGAPDTIGGHFYQYDSVGRILSDTYPTATSPQKSTYSYEPNNKIEKTDANGHTTTYSYQSYGNPAQKYLMSITDALGIATTITRDSLGHLLTVTQGSLTRKFAYDSAFYLTSIVDPETGETVFGRDADGNMTSKQVGSAKPIGYKYDAMNRLIEADYPDAASALTKVYDKNGNLINVTKGSSNWIYSYDANNNLTDENLAIDGQTFKLHYDVDPYGRLDDMVYPNGDKLSFAPNGFGQATELGSYVTKITYGLSGLWSGFTYGNNVTAVQAFNDRNFPSLIHYTTPTANVVRAYSYDPANNITTIEDSINDKNTINITYDADNRVASASGIWGSDVYTYSVNGDILTKTHNNQPTPTQYTYDANDKLTKVTGDINLTPTYDGYGNITSDGINTYQYTSDGNMMLMQSSAARDAYTYDGNQHRVKELVKDGTLYNIYNKSGLLLYQYNLTTKTSKENIYFQGHKLAQVDITPSGRTNTYYLVDLLGSPLAQLDQNGKILWQGAYDAYGVRTNKTATNTNSQWYTGKTEDQDSGLDYYGARYYNPALGRFMSPDPAGYSDSNPMSFNRYIYANDNPYSYDDPTGWFSWSWSWGDFGGGFSFGFSFSFGGASSAHNDSIGYYVGDAMGAIPGSLMMLSGGAEVRAGEAIAGAVEDVVAEEGAASSETATTNSINLPKNPDDLVEKHGYDEISNPDAAANGHRTFEHPETGDKLEFDIAKPGRNGFAGVDHYHWLNPENIGKRDYYFDKNGVPVPNGSKASHLYPEDD